MTDEVKADVIKETQNILGKFIKKPTLTEKLLKKPPFRFLHDICTSHTVSVSDESDLTIKLLKDIIDFFSNSKSHTFFLKVMKETGFFENVLTPDDNIENIRDKEGKIEFLQKVIATVEAASGIKLTLKPNKVVAGLEATKTNEFLQALGKALENRQADTKSSKIAPPKTKVSKKTAKEVKEEPPDKKKGSKSKKIIENGMKETVEKKGVETLASPKKKHSSKKTNQTTPREDEKPQKRIKSEREEAPAAKEVKSTHGAGESTDLPDVDIIRVNGVEGQGDQNMTVKEEVLDVEQKRVSEKHKHRRPSIYNVQDETKHEEVIENNENLKPKADSLSEKTLNEKILPNRSEIPLKERNTTPNPASQSNYPKKDANLVKEGALVSRPRTGIRATTARPASARPAAPRIRDRGEVAVAEEVMKPASGKVQVIVDDETANEEDENLISLEMPNDILLEEPPSTLPKSEPPKEEEHGHLVEQILDVQRELEDNSRFSEPKPLKKTEIEWESGRNRESTNREIEKLRISIQNLTRTANPLGKLLDFFQEDIEIVQKELETWREKNIHYCSQIAQEKSTTNRYVEPLKVHLKELQQNIEEQLHQISAVKANIIRNDEKIHKLLAGL